MSMGWPIAILGALVILVSIICFSYGSYLAEAYTDQYETNWYGEVINPDYEPIAHAKGKAIVEGSLLGFIFGGVLAAFGWYLIHMDIMLEKERIRHKGEESKD